MKTSAIIRIIVWSLVILLLTGVLVFFLVPQRSSARQTSWARVPIRESTAESIAAVPLEEMVTFSPDQVSALDIEWAAGTITIYPTDRQDIAISEAGASEAKDTMVHRLREGTLSIRFCEAGIHTINQEKDLYVYVPRDWTCRELEIDAASARVEIRDMTIRELNLDGASGECTLTDCQIGGLDIDTASGDVFLSGTLESLDFDAASASFTAELSNTPGRIDMDSMSGTLDIALPEDCGYAVRMEGLSSSFQSEFPGGMLQGDGRCRINVEGLNCRVNIRKLSQ